jgi:hypothetical protein
VVRPRAVYGPDGRISLAAAADGGALDPYQSLAAAAAASGRPLLAAGPGEAGGAGGLGESAGLGAGVSVSARPALFDFSAVHAQAQDSFARLRAAGFVVGLSPVQARPQHAVFAPAPEPLHDAAQFQHQQYQHQPQQQQEQQPPLAAPLPTASSSASSLLGATQPAAPGLHHAQSAATTTLNVALPMYVPPAPLVGLPQPPVSPPLGFFGFAGQPPATPGALAALQQLFQAQAQAPPTMAQTAMSGAFQQASASAALRANARVVVHRGRSAQPRPSP